MERMEERVPEVVYLEVENRAAAKAAPEEAADAFHSAYKAAIAQGKYVGFYYVLRDEDSPDRRVQKQKSPSVQLRDEDSQGFDVESQIDRFMQMVMGKRCDARPALDISQVDADCGLRALKELRRRCRVEPAIFKQKLVATVGVIGEKTMDVANAGTAEEAFYCGYPIWVEGNANDSRNFLLADQDRLCIAVD